MDYAANAALLARSEAAIGQAKRPKGADGDEQDPWGYDLDWDEDARLRESRSVLRQAQRLSAVLQPLMSGTSFPRFSTPAGSAGCLPPQSCGRLASLSGTYAAAINLGLKTIPVDRCRHRDREIRLLAIARGLMAAAGIGIAVCECSCPELGQILGYAIFYDQYVLPASHVEHDV
ncbi:DUF1612 domain-containing protein [Rhizobium rhizogenes]|uniref:DUF1612 domain-containing protein n=1 Tax=Rhizobium rhizogenes TaxID=359 RepID=A0AA95AGS9_RHIRH|nr:DUF1612 domain-containing protein [Rhizobium rhizogenes]